MNLYLVRHTQTILPPGVCYGQTDIPVAKSFEKETEIIRTKLTNTPFTHCFSSPLERCRKLANELAGNLPIQTDRRLMEMHFGKWEMRLWEDLQEEDEAKYWFNNFIHRPCPAGESYEQLLGRIQQFANDLRLLPKKAEVLIVTHAGCIRAFLCLLAGFQPSTVFDVTIDYGEIRKLPLETKTPLKKQHPSR